MIKFQTKKSFQISACFISIFSLLNFIQPHTLRAEPFSEKPTLLSDYTGKASSLQESGIKLDQSITQFFGGVTNGGRNEGDHYSGRWDLLTSVDGQKSGLWPGLFMKMRVGANWHPIDRFGAGTVLNPYTPAAFSKSDNESIAITDLSVIQMLSPRYGVTFGKMDTIDSDYNSFAHGRGLEQFQNLAFVLNAVPMFVPPSTLGAGVFALYEDSTPLASIVVLDTHDVPTQSGFDDLFSEGAVISANIELPVTINSLPGRHRLGYVVSTGENISLDQDPRFVLEEGGLKTGSNSWAVTYNAEQFLVSDPNDPKRGWGIFARAGLSDPDKNIFHYLLSFGVGGSGVISSRLDDRFGLGVFHLEVSDTFIDRIIKLDNEKGIELFYDIAALPWIRVGADLQYVNGTLRSADNAFIASGRLRFLL